MLGAGRPASAKPEVLGTRELSREEVLTVKRAQNSGAVKKFRDSHHMVARLFAMGLRPGAVAARVGYSLVRISTLSADPAFQELVAVYRNDVNESFKEGADEYFETVNQNRRIAARLLNDKLNSAEPEDLTISQLVAVHADAADRTGYPKRSVAVNVNVDFAAKLDNAIKRSAEVKALPPPSSQSIDRGGEGPAEITSRTKVVSQDPQLFGEILAPMRRRA